MMTRHDGLKATANFALLEDLMAVQRLIYFISQYPKVSHSFVRREMQALEALGFAVTRISLRGWDAELVDAADIAERDRTVYVLKDGALPLLRATFAAFLTSPLRFLRTVRCALRMSRQSDRSALVHLVYLAEACMIWSLIKNSSERHIHAHFGTNPAEVLALLHVLKGVTFSFTIHGPEEFDKPYGIHLPEKIRLAKFVVAVSSFGRSQVYRWANHRDWPKIQVVHCGLERAFFDVPPSPFPTAPRLVCVGRLCEQKGQLLLVEAAAQLKLEGIPFELVLGGDGEMRAEIERLVHRYGLSDHVKITGWLSSDQVRSEILKARALVLPSFGEGLPVVLMEAMALRRPVISTYIAGIPELVTAGVHGWLLPAGSIQALTEAMRACLATPPEQLAEMGHVARERALARHDAMREAGKLADLFRQERFE
jgi:glycosyltransferase involved in cell wall biosynthesis